MRQFLSRWGSTFIFVSFLITSVTGVLLFYRIRTPPNEVLHIWIGFLMIAGAIFHIARNWQAFLSYFRKPRFYIALGITGIICGLFAYPAVFGAREQRGPGGPAAFRSALAVNQAIANAPLSDIAGFTHQDITALFAQLAEQGIVTSNADTTLNALAQASGTNSADIAATLLAN